MTAIILRADSAQLPLPDASADLIVTSPPYWQLRDYADGGKLVPGQVGAEATPLEYVRALLACTAEWVRVLKPSGSLFVNMGDRYSGRGHGPNRGNGTGRGEQGGSRLSLSRGPMEKSLLNLPARYAIGCTDSLGLIQRAEIIWSKPRPVPESAGDRIHRSHEVVYHFTRSRRYYAAADEIRDLPDSDWDELDDAGPVWRVGFQPLRLPAWLGVKHSAAFPPELPRRCILGWSPPGGIVLDPFGGTGTTALVADVLGRTGITADISADYCRAARWRVNDPKQRERAAAARPG